MADAERDAPSEFFTYREDIPLDNQAKIVASNDEIFGYSTMEYEIRRRRIVHSLDSGRGYQINSRQRLTIPGSFPNFQAAGKGYLFPAQVDCSVRLVLPEGSKAKVRLLSVFPRTLNSVISESQSSASGSGASSSRSVTAGSTTGSVDTAGVSINAGMMGPIPVAGVEASYSHSWERSSSQTQGTERGTSSTSEASAGYGMSIKDWGIYSNLASSDPSMAAWICGQSYPWDTLMYNETGKDNEVVNLPSFVLSRMWSPEDKTVLPPSHLALYGIDFTMMVTWIVEYPKNVQEDEEITVERTIKRRRAISILRDSKLFVSLEETDQIATNVHNATMDLALSGLTPILSRGFSNGAAVGFTTTPWVASPQPNKDLKIASQANNLLISGGGFNQDMQITGALLESVIGPGKQPEARLCLAFKVTDIDQEYVLSLVHWVNRKDTACVLSFKVNGLKAGEVYVVDAEGEGSQQNLTRIALRDLNYTSPTARDYLNVGLNQIDIEFTLPPGIDRLGPLADKIWYTLRAVSID